MSGGTPYGDVNYERTGAGYGQRRRTDPRIAALVWEALGAATSVINVGAGAGSYEPVDRHVVAVEPSASMRAQRGRDMTPAVDATAEDLPFPDDSFDAAMAMVTVHLSANGLSDMSATRAAAVQEAISARYLHTPRQRPGAPPQSKRRAEEKRAERPGAITRRSTGRFRRTHESLGAEGSISPERRQLSRSWPHRRRASASVHSERGQLDPIVRRRKETGWVDPLCRQGISQWSRW